MNLDVYTYVSFTLYMFGYTVLSVPHPISLHASHTHRLVFASSKRSKSRGTRGAVYAYHMRSLIQVRVYTLIRMDHPTGIAIYGDELYVADQKTNSIYAFDVQSGKFLRRVLVLDSKGDASKFSDSNSVSPKNTKSYSDNLYSISGNSKSIDCNGDCIYIEEDV